MAYENRIARSVAESRRTPWHEDWPKHRDQIHEEVNPLAGILAGGLNSVERSLDGSWMGLMWPNTLDDVFRQYQYGQDPRAEDIGSAALEVGVPSGVLSAGRKVAQKAVGRSMVARHGTDESKKIYDNEIVNRDPSRRPHWLFRDKEAMQKSPDYEPRSVDDIDDLPGKLEYMHDNALGLAWKGERRATPVPEGQQPKAIFVTGPAAAGKSAIADPIARQYNAAIPDPDEAKKILPGYDGGVGANAVHDQSKHIYQSTQDRLVQERYNIVVPTVGDDPIKLQAKAQQLRDAGYEVHLVNMDVPADAAKDRMLRRSAHTGRHVPLDVFEPKAKAAGQSFGVLKQNQNKTFDGIAQVDNHTVGPKVDKPILMDTAGLLQHIAGFR